MAARMKIIGILTVIYITYTTAGERIVKHSETGVQVFLENESTWHVSDNKRKRQTVVTGLTDDQHQQAVDKHNSLRVQEGGSNIIMLRKNQVLAEMAQEWAEGCNWDHGNPDRDPSVKPYGTLGQNLFMLQGSQTALDIESATQDWYDEKADYSYDTLSCEAGKACGHYTQVVWADTKEIGCGASACDVITKESTGQTWNNVVYIVCNYGPTGNYDGVKPFLVGTPCTQCSSGQMTCFNSLCYESNCDEGDTMCTCAAECANCGEVTDECRCDCTPGWSGNTCTVPCVDTKDTCFLDISYCTDDYWRAELERDCPVTCGVCTVASEDTPTCSEDPSNDDNNDDTDDDSNSENHTGSHNQPSMILVYSLLSVLVFGRGFMFQ